MSDRIRGVVGIGSDNPRGLSDRIPPKRGVVGILSLILYERQPTIIPQYSHSILFFKMFLVFLLLNLLFNIHKNDNFDYISYDFRPMGLIFSLFFDLFHIKFNEI